MDWTPHGLGQEPHAEELRRVVTLPDTEGEVVALLSDLDEVLAGVAAWAREEGVLFPDALPAEQADQAVARLASLSRAWERAVQDLEASTKVLAAPNGFDLVSLHFVEIDCQDLAAILSAIGSLAAAFAGIPFEG